MEHIIQFGVSIDDDKIEKTVIKAASDHLKTEVREQIFSKSKSGWDRGFTPLIERIVRDVLTEWKQEILEKAAENVADSIKRSKAYKEKVKEITNAV